MRCQYRHRWYLLIILALFVVVGCDDDLTTDPDGDEIPRAPVLFALSHASLAFTALGDSARLTVWAKDAFGDEIGDPDVYWASTDLTVAEVTEQGLVVARGNGVARVIATLGALADTASVTVGQVVAASELSQERAVLAEGDTLRLVATFTDSMGSPVPDGWIAWSSTNPQVLMVDSTGLVTARRAGGTAEVTATAGGRSEQAAVRVLDQIAFVYSGEVHRINEDGSGLRPLTSGAGALDAIWSPNGQQLAFRSHGDDLPEVRRINADGSGDVLLAAGPAYIDHLDWSPDGGRIAFTSYNPAPQRNEIHVMNRDGSDRIALTPAGSSDEYPRWSPDGKQIAFLRVRPIGIAGTPGNNILTMDPDGSGQTTINNALGWLSDLSWSPDGGKLLALHSIAGGSEIAVLNADGSDLTRYRGGMRYISHPVWAPVGAKIAFRGDEDGYEAYVANPDGTGLVKVTTDADIQPAVTWSPDGDRLLFWTLREGTVDLYLVRVAGGSPRLIFRAPWAGEENYLARWRPRPAPR